MKLLPVSEMNWEETKKEKKLLQHLCAILKLLFIILSFSSSLAPFVQKVPLSNETIKAWQFKYAILFFSSVSASHQDKLYPLLHYQQSHCYPK